MRRKNNREHRRMQAAQRQCVLGVRYIRLQIKPENASPLQALRYNVALWCRLSQPKAR